MAAQTRLDPAVTSFFSNKIPCTLDDWFEALVVVASVYERFDGKPYDRDNIVREFEKIATRNATTLRATRKDPSDYRDEYSAYGSYLGIFYVERQGGRLICRVSKAAKELLCGHSPDPEAFCRFQMAMYQYPDGTGVVYRGGLRLQKNSANTKIREIEGGVLFAPYRVILDVLLYMAEDAQLKTQAHLTFDDLYFLFNAPEVHQSSNIAAFRASLPGLILRLTGMRTAMNNPYHADTRFKRNFHILERTGLILQEGGRLKLSFKLSDSHKLAAAKAIASLGVYFYDFSKLAGPRKDMERDILDIVLSGAWGRYFDGMNLHYDAVSTLNYDDGGHGHSAGLENHAPFPPLQDYRLFRFPGSSHPSRGMPDYARSKELREKRNVRHREILDCLARKLTALGSRPRDNVFMDMTASLNGKDFIFEAKTVAENDIIDRVREAVAQLLEYRFRSKQVVNDPRLVLLLGAGPPQTYEWVFDYLAELGIQVCWVAGDRICAREADRAVFGLLCDTYR